MRELSTHEVHLVTGADLLYRAPTHIWENEGDSEIIFDDDGFSTAFTAGFAGGVAGGVVTGLIGGPKAAAAGAIGGAAGALVGAAVTIPNFVRRRKPKITIIELPPPQ